MVDIMNMNTHELDTSDLAPQFDEFYKSGQRIEVEIDGEMIKRGYVGKTTGWRPSYLLLNNTRSTSSEDLLGHGDRVLKRLNRWR